jgi:hypothetical protein
VFYGSKFQLCTVHPPFMGQWGLKTAISNRRTRLMFRI